MRQRIAGIVALALVTVGVVVVLFQPLALVNPGTYDRTTVSLHDENGTQLATVDVRIADTRDKRRVGLSRTDSLASGDGMLFVHPSPGRYTYVMRNMSFPLDIVFVAANGTITRVHSAPVDGDGPYRGHGKYILEVPQGWTTAQGIGVGDEVRVPENVTAGG